MNLFFWRAQQYKKTKIELMISVCVDSESQITTCDCNPWIHGRLRCSTRNIVHLSLIIEDEGP